MFWGRCFPILIMVVAIRGNPPLLLCLAKPLTLKLCHSSYAMGAYRLCRASAYACEGGRLCLWLRCFPDTRTLRRKLCQTTFPTRACVRTRVTKRYTFLWQTIHVRKNDTRFSRLRCGAICDIIVLWATFLHSLLTTGLPKTLFIQKESPPQALFLLSSPYAPPVDTP